MPNWVANHLQIHGENAAEVLRSLLTEDKEADDGFNFDFNKIIPMPDSLKIESGLTTNSCVELYLTSMNPFVDYYGENKISADDFLKVYRSVQGTKSFGRFNAELPLEKIRKLEDNICISENMNQSRKLTKEEAIAYGKNAVDNVLNYGAKDWYDWSISNWGTKWNACDTQIPDSETAEVYFDTAWSPVTNLMCVLSEKYPDHSFEYAYAEEQAGNFAGSVIFQDGCEISGGHYNNESKEAYEIFFELWGMKDEFKFNEKTGTYEYIDDEAEM